MVILLVLFLPATFSLSFSSGATSTFSVASWDLSNSLGPSNNNIPRPNCSDTLIIAVLNALNTEVVAIQELENGTANCPMDLINAITTKTPYQYKWYQLLRQYGANGGTTGNLILSKNPALSTSIAFFRFTAAGIPLATGLGCEIPRDGDYCEGAMAVQISLNQPYQTYGVWIVNALLANNTVVQTDQANQLFNKFIAPKNNAFLPQPTIATGNFNTFSQNSSTLTMFNSLMNNSWTSCGAGPPLTYPTPLPEYKLQQMYFNGSFLAESTFSTDATVVSYPSSLVCRSRFLSEGSYVFNNNSDLLTASFHLPVIVTFTVQIPSILDIFGVFSPSELATLILAPFFSIIGFFFLVWMIYLCACKKKDDAYNEWKHTPLEDLNNKPQQQDNGAMGTFNRGGGYQQASQRVGGGGGPPANRGGFQEVEDPPRETNPRGQYDTGYDEEPPTQEPPRRAPPPPRGPRDDYDDYDRPTRGGGAPPPPPPARRDGRPPPPPRGGPRDTREYPDDDPRGGSRGNASRPRTGQLL